MSADHQATPSGRYPVVGMVGAGQLARMTAQAAIGLGIGFRVFAKTREDSAAQISPDSVLSDDSVHPADVLAFAQGCDVVTFDHEQVPAPVLADIADTGAAVRPGAQALRFAQDKAEMRERLTSMEALTELGVGCPRYRVVTSLAEVTAFAAETGGWPVVLKTAVGGYDGKGVWRCDDEDEAARVLGYGLHTLAEEYVAFDAELAVLVARSPKNQGAAYPVVQTIQRNGICREVIAPAPGVGERLAITAQAAALTIARELDVTGLLAVELFAANGRLLVNELAMRPHNCGHWTMDGAVTSQFEQHLRAVLDLPLGSPAMQVPCAVMVNILGGTDPDLYDRFIHVMAADPGLKVHLYGKEVRPGRKIGHVTVAGDDLHQLRERAWRAASYLSLGTEELPGGGVR